jgi:lipopolysaccharide/colanic/teichoic acid biosynthesis glycosyltransferase
MLKCELVLWVLGRSGSLYADEIDVYTSAWPGVMGFWQVLDRSSTRFFQQAIYNMYYYIRDWLFWLDIYNLFYTIWVD